MEIVYEDESLLVVNKPAGMLSVPGKSDVDSVYQQIETDVSRGATGPMVDAHRLDGNIHSDPRCQDKGSAPELAGTV
ncbi:MAG: hypothetical protein V8T12_02605 [Parabacteroides johnsonii]